MNLKCWCGFHKFKATKYIGKVPSLIKKCERCGQIAQFSVRMNGVSVKLWIIKKGK